jgi:hypothetical protein
MIAPHRNQTGSASNNPKVSIDGLARGEEAALTRFCLMLFNFNEFMFID